jgi:hypothetical protein
MFELNEMRNVATIGYDTGAIYGGRDLSSRVRVSYSYYNVSVVWLVLINTEFAPRTGAWFAYRGRLFASICFTISITHQSATQKPRAFAKLFT